MKQSPCHGFDYGNVSLLVLASFFFFIQLTVLLIVFSQPHHNLLFLPHRKYPVPEQDMRICLSMAHASPRLRHTPVTATLPFIVTYFLL